MNLIPTYYLSTYLPVQLAVVRFDDPRDEAQGLLATLGGGQRGHVRLHARCGVLKALDARLGGVGNACEELREWRLWPRRVRRLRASGILEVTADHLLDLSLSESQLLELNLDD